MRISFKGIRIKMKKMRDYFELMGIFLK